MTLPKNLSPKAQEDRDAIVPMVSRAQVLAALPLLEHLPVPAMEISSDYDIVWMNQAALKVYGTAKGKCYAVSHGYRSPCDLNGELCPKTLAEQQHVPNSVVHVHCACEGQEYFKVIALPIEEGGVLEWGIPVGDVSTVDGVTGLLTRAEVEQVARRMQALMARMNSSFAIVMWDIDHFKAVNDKFGHAAGDKVLRQTGDLISRMLRKSDVLGRWGGEEFFTLLPNTDRATAVLLVDRIMDAIRTNCILVDDTELNLSISAGLRWVSGADAPAQNFDALVDDADCALYKAKHEGRNRCVVHHRSDYGGNRCSKSGA